MDDAGGEAEDAEELVSRLITASRVLVAIAARSLSAMDNSLTVPQFRLLVVLRNRGATNLSRLAEDLNVNPSTTARMLERLTAAGMVQRTMHPDNRKEVQLVITRAGRNIVRRVTEVRRAEMGRIVAAMPQQSRMQLIEALTAFNEAGGEQPEDLPALPGWQ